VFKLLRLVFKLQRLAFKLLRLVLKLQRLAFKLQRLASVQVLLSLINSRDNWNKRRRNSRS
jgi:hypothetical protein